jgi:hypoxanthine phosphoribosyltransferase
VIRVRTVGRREFRQECGRLWDRVQHSFQPQLVIGVRSGGWWVAEEMRLARQVSGVVFAPLTCRRPTSELKGRSRALRFVLQVLPYFMLDGLRLLEYYALTLPRCRKVARQGFEARIADREELAAVQRAIASLPIEVRVLVVDDSLDSGATLASVVAMLRAALPPQAVVRTAAFTVLGPAPIVAADFSLLQRINCRFPWSYDFHG